MVFGRTKWDRDISATRIHMGRDIKKDAQGKATTIFDSCGQDGLDHTPPGLVGNSSINSLVRVRALSLTAADNSSRPEAGVRPERS